MILHIDDTQTVADLQDKFSRCFPGLKIEFYKVLHHHKEMFLTGNRIEGHQYIGAIRKNHEPGNFEIMSWYTTARLGREFRDRFDLNVQVYRKERGVWIALALTDKLTLLEHMEKASHAREAFFPKRKAPRREYEYL